MSPEGRAGDGREYAEWKRNGVAGTYVVLVEERRGGRAKVRPVYHSWTTTVLEKPHARWTDERRLRPLSAYHRERLAALATSLESAVQEPAR